MGAERNPCRKVLELRPELSFRPDCWPKRCPIFFNKLWYHFRFLVKEWKHIVKRKSNLGFLGFLALSCPLTFYIALLITFPPSPPSPPGPTAAAGTLFHCLSSWQYTWDKYVHVLLWRVVLHWIVLCFHYGMASNRFRSVALHRFCAASWMTSIGNAQEGTITRAI